MKKASRFLKNLIYFDFWVIMLLHYKGFSSPLFCKLLKSSKSLFPMFLIKSSKNRVILLGSIPITKILSIGMFFVFPLNGVAIRGRLFGWILSKFSQ